MFGHRLRYMLIGQIFGCSKILLVAENGRLGMNILWGRLEHNGETIRKDGWRLRISRTQGGGIQKKWQIRKLRTLGVNCNKAKLNLCQRFEIGDIPVQLYHEIFLISVSPLSPVSIPPPTHPANPHSIPELLKL